MHQECTRPGSVLRSLYRLPSREVVAGWCAVGGPHSGQNVYVGAQLCNYFSLLSNAHHTLKVKSGFVVRRRLGDAELSLHLFKRDSFSLRKKEENDKKLKPHHESKEDEGIPAGRCGQQWEDS